MIPWLHSPQPADQQRGILIALGLGLALFLLAACAPEPVRPTVEAKRCPASLVAACAVPPYLRPGQADGPTMVENHVEWVCGFWACAERQRALAECDTGEPQPPLAVPPGCRSAPAEGDRPPE